MGQVVYEKQTRAYWLPSVAVLAAPTPTEITAGDYLGRLMTKDGLAWNFNEATVDLGGIETTFNAQIGGSWGVTPTLRLFRDDEDESDGYDLIVKGTRGILLVSYFGVPADESKVATVPAEMGIAQLGNSATNEPQSFTVQMFARAEPRFDAVVTAP